MDALKQAHIASDEYCSLANTVGWSTTFEFPQSAVDEDHQLCQEYGHDFTLMCKIKQSMLAANRLSVERVKCIFDDQSDKVQGMAQRDFLLLLDFAENGITPIIGYDFVPEATNIPPLRARYEKVVHTVNSLLFVQFKNGTMLIMKTAKAQTIPGVHYSPQHHAESKEKPEGRVIGDLSGQHILPSMVQRTARTRCEHSYRTLVVKSSIPL